VIRIGCSGWNYRDWRGAFYPQGLQPRDWLEHYARAFDTVEVNATFYRLAKVEAVARWVQQTPPEFCFTVKASRYLTHIRRLRDPAESIERFYAPLAPLQAAGRLGPVLWQLPPDFRRDDERLEGLLALLPPGRHAVEFRHESWFRPDVYARLRADNIALVAGHRRGLDLPLDVVTADFAFIRFHYGERGRRGNYSQTELDHWARAVEDLARAELDVYAYFNNDWEAFAPRNARGLIRRLQDSAARSAR
jgi:uncharacterized protein YecE (DUF72 family)